MSKTYRTCIQKYEARVKKCKELGIPARESDVAKLMHYVGRAEKKGIDEEISIKDRVQQKAITLKYNLKELVNDPTDLLDNAANLLKK